MQISLQTVYDNLEQIDRVDPTTSAIYRQSAQEVLADPDISLEWRKAISDRLNQVNHELTVHAHVMIAINWWMVDGGWWMVDS
jgi:hypothetical protein